MKRGAQRVFPPATAASAVAGGDGSGAAVPDAAHNPKPLRLEGRQWSRAAVAVGAAVVLLALGVLAWTVSRGCSRVQGRGCAGGGVSV